MALNQSKVTKSLERKLKIVGFEVPDILAIFILLAVLNFVFASSQYKLFLSWGPALLFALLLRLGKRGKPEGYLVHLAKYHFGSKYFSAFKKSTNNNLSRTKKGGQRNG